jgi:hypothetical protein
MVQDGAGCLLKVAYNLRLTATKPSDINHIINNLKLEKWT